MLTRERPFKEKVMVLPWKMSVGCWLNFFLEESLRFVAQILNFLLWLSAKKVQMQPPALFHSVP